MRASQQIHSNAYRNPDQLPEGAVLVIGAGSSGVQIADELLRVRESACHPLGRQARPSATKLSRARLRLVVGRARQVGRRSQSNPATGACHDLGERCPWWPDTVDFRRLAARGHDARLAVTHVVRGWRAELRPGSRRTIWRARRCQLPVAPGRSRRLTSPATVLTFPKSPMPAKIERGPGLRQRPHPLIEPGGRRHQPRSSGRQASLLISAGWTLTPSTNKGRPKHQRGVSSEPGDLFPGFAVAVATGGPRSSGASGTTPSSWPTTSPRSAAIWPIAAPPRARPRARSQGRRSPNQTRSPDCNAWHPHARGPPQNGRCRRAPQ